MQTPQTKLENGPYRYFLVGFVADDTPLTLQSLPTWQNGLWGGAIIQKYTVNRAVSKTIIYRVQLERIEIQTSPNKKNIVYTAVIRAPNPQSFYSSNPIPFIEDKLKQGAEVYLLWNRVPVHYRWCHHCGTNIKSNTAVYFEDGLPTCSPYCTLLVK